MTTLEVKIIVRYDGLKATQYFQKYTSDSDKVLRDDLLLLKLPLPKLGNTTFISHGCVECRWPLIRRDSVLYKHIITKARPHKPGDQKAFATLLAKFSISSLVVKEIYPTTKGPKNLKRPYPFTNDRPSSKLLPQSDAVAPDAEAFLQDVSDSLRPHKIPKLEPVDIPLPPDPRTLAPPPRSSSSLSSHISSATNPPESVSSSSSLVPRQLTLHSKLSSHTNPLLLLPSKPPTPILLLPPKPPPPPKSDPTTLPDAPAPIKEMLREQQLQPLLSASQSLPELSRRQLPLPDSVTSSQRSLEATTVTTLSRAKASDIPTIQRLTREACDIRRQFTADTIRDAEIISELKQLNAAFIPRPLIKDDSALESRIRKLEQDLDNEKRMRLEAENVVKDIRREYKTPFVVPGLLDAFIKLSRLTTQATRSSTETVTKYNG